MLAPFRRNSCSSNSNNSDYNNKNLFTIRLISYAIWSLLTLTSATVRSAAIYSNVDFLANPKFEPLCSVQQEHFIESEGKESSLILEFNPGVLAEKKKSCTRILSAPSNYGFIVRLILPKIRHGHQQDLSASRHSSSSVAEVGAMDAPKISAASAINEMTSLIEKLNSTSLKSVLGRTCPLSVFSSLDPHTPQWRLDPCQLEDTAPDMEDPVRLFHGRVRIVWEHGYNKLKSKLMVTVLGKGDQCRSETKHQCLKIGDEPILCISKDLVCDGIRHCPYSNEYDSDEDYAMCWKRRRFGEPIPPAMESDIFEHFALEVFRNLFAYDSPSLHNEPTSATASPGGANSTTLRKIESKEVGVEAHTESNSFANASSTQQAENSTEGSVIGGHGRRNSTRSGLNSDLSKYGPWGYLMLGMLLCGGALLICGLWASATQHAANNERESALQNANGSSLETSNAGPPNYEEIDPPPAYSVLFPNQKAASNATLSSLAAATIGAPSGATTRTAAADAATAATSTPTLTPSADAATASTSLSQAVQARVTN